MTSPHTATQTATVTVKVPEVTAKLLDALRLALARIEELEGELAPTQQPQEASRQTGYYPEGMGEDPPCCGASEACRDCPTD